VRLLLTGATGFLGKRVATRLAADGHALRLLLRPGRATAGLPKDAEIVRGDVTDARAFAEAALGCDAVLHMAALVKTWVPHPREFDRVNVGGLKNALAAARQAGARLFYTSSFMAIGPTTREPADETRRHPGIRYCNAYERTKAEADALAQAAAAAGQDVVMLYPGVLYGEGELTDGNLVVRMVLDHIHGRFPGYVGPADRLWSFTFVDDVVAGHALALARGQAGERYLLCGENLPVTDLFAWLERGFGIAAPRRHIPFALASLVGRAMVAWAELTGLPPRLTNGVVDVFRENWCYSSDKARRELDYRVTPLQQGLQRTMTWLRQDGHL
jgi:farnesol dehydrogenase